MDARPGYTFYEGLGARNATFVFFVRILLCPRILVKYMWMFLDQLIIGDILLLKVGVAIAPKVALLLDRKHVGAILPFLNIVRSHSFFCRCGQLSSALNLHLRILHVHAIPRVSDVAGTVQLIGGCPARYLWLPLTINVLLHNRYLVESLLTLRVLLRVLFNQHI